MSSVPGSLTVAQAQAIIDQRMTPWVNDLGMIVEELGTGTAVLRMPWHERLARDGGLVTGQALLAFADAAMVVVIASSLGEFRPMATVDMTTSFLAPARNTDVIARGEVVRRGKRTVFGRIDLYTADTDEAVALIQTTWSLLG